MSVRCSQKYHGRVQSKCQLPKFNQSNFCKNIFKQQSIILSNKHVCATACFQLEGHGQWCWNFYLTQRRRQNNDHHYSTKISIKNYSPKISITKTIQQKYQ